MSCLSFSSAAAAPLLFQQMTSPCASQGQHNEAFQAGVLRQAPQQCLFAQSSLPPECIEALLTSFWADPSSLVPPTAWLDMARRFCVHPDSVRQFARTLTRLLADKTKKPYLCITATGDDGKASNDERTFARSFLRISAPAPNELRFRAMGAFFRASSSFFP